MHFIYDAANINSLLFAASVNFRCNTDKLCDIGTIDAHFKDIYATGRLLDAPMIDNLLSMPTTQTTGNLLSFTSTAKIIEDSKNKRYNECQFYN